MKNNTLNSHKRINSETQDKTFDSQSFSYEKGIDINIRDWFSGNYSYSGPFLPIVNVTLVFDELKKMVKEWLTAKNKN
ncbi:MULTISPECIES: hypothetical protein [Chryseobacterium group]|uniref:hypothetical protein n=1 Tax=Chryseobacterium group TaxID=2782232 RepID=UPI0021E5B495|nr:MULTISPECIES: hypothetical protein [Chryseobacterium group]MDP9955021.1 hypothetical protein [Epilithonimonas hungarica]